jgi:hypothetical protein
VLLLGIASYCALIVTLQARTEVYGFRDEIIRTFGEFMS